MRDLLAICLAISIPVAAPAQSVFKCRQGNSVTYSNTPCEKLGLKSVGEVQNRITTVPGTKPSTGMPDAGSKKPSPTVPGNEVDMPKTSTIKPINPLIEKLLK